MLSFLIGWLEGPVMFAQDLGWFVLAACGPALLCYVLLLGYGPNSVLMYPRRPKFISLGLWVALLLVYDFTSSEGHAWFMGAGILLWVVAIVYFAVQARLAMRDLRKGEEAEYP